MHEWQCTADLQSGCRPGVDGMQLPRGMALARAASAAGVSQFIWLHSTGHTGLITGEIFAVSA